MPANISATTAPVPTQTTIKPPPKAPISPSAQSLPATSPRTAAPAHSTGKHVNVTA